MTVESVKSVACRVLDRVLTFDADPHTALGLARIVASGAIVLTVGAGLAVSSYVRAGFKWPSQRSGWV